MNIALNWSNKWEFIEMNHRIKLKQNAEDTSGKQMPIDQEYNLILIGRFYSIIEDKNNIQYYINNKYIEKS